MKPRITHYHGMVLLTALLLSFVSKSYAAWDEKVEINGLYYYLFDPENYSYATSNYAYLTSPETGDYSGKIVIPPSVEYGGKTYEVTAIRSYAFCYERDVTSISIPNTITEIGTNAFLDCNNLRTLTIPESVTTMGIDLFGGCRLNPLILKTGIDSYKDVFKQFSTSGNVVYAYSSEIDKIKQYWKGTVYALDIPYSLNVVDTYDKGVKFEIRENQYVDEALSYGIDQLSIGEWNGNLLEHVQNITVQTENTYLLSDMLKPKTTYKIVLSYHIDGAAKEAEAVFTTDGETFSDYSTGVQITLYITSSTQKTCSVGTGDHTCAIDPTTNGTVTIPAQSSNYTIHPLTITGICPSAFANCQNMTSVTIPNTVTSIGSEAFKNCGSLTAVNVQMANPFPIDNSVFAGIPATATLYVPYGLKSAYEQTAGWNQFHSIVEKRFAGDVFTSTTIEGVTMSFKVLDAEEKTCEVTGENMPAVNRSTEGVVTVPSEAEGFSVTGIGRFAFMECIKLTSIVIPNSVTTIGQYAFSACYGLTTPVYNDHIFAFLPYSYSGEYAIPDGITTIADGAFQNINQLTALAIPNSVTTIGSNAFVGCTNVRTLTVDMERIPQTVFDGLKSITKLVIGNSVKEIGPAFREFTNLGSVEFGSSVERIGYGAFMGCKNLKSVDLPSSVTYLGGEAFRECGLTYCVVPNSVTTAETGLFFNCMNLRCVVLGSSIQKLGASLCYGCSKLEVIVSLSTTPPTLNSAFDNSVHFLVPNNALEAYQAAPFWSTLKKMSTFETVPVLIKHESAGAVSCRLSYYPIDATHGYGLQKAEEDLVVYGLDPNTTTTDKTIQWTMADGNHGTTAITVTTTKLTFETLAAQATSNTRALISAKTNGEDDGMRFGFEWRRYDAPDLVPSNFDGCPVYDGMIAGTLNGLSANTYYKYRPFYKSDAGKTYYGEWLAFGTADAYVYFEPVVHTYEVSSVTENEALLKGSAMAGSDDILEQGFEYWVKDADSNNRAIQNVQTVSASGIIMTTRVTNLAKGTTYGYRAYVKTAKETTYGEDCSFTTLGDASGIESVVIADDQPKVFNIYTLSGSMIRRQATSLDGLPRGIYIVNHKKIMVR